MVLVGLWLVLTGVSAVVFFMTGSHVSTCLFRAATGYPCAACGGTRAGLSLVRGELSGAWSFNPAATIVLITSPLIGVWVWRGRRPIAAWIRVLLWALVPTGLAINWWYVITHLPMLERVGQ